MERGAFSNKDVVKASRKIVPVFVDCNWGKKNTDITSKYGIRGYPTVLFLDPKGEIVDRMKGRDPGSITKQIESLAKKFPGKPKGPAATLQLSLEEGYDAAYAKAEKADKPLLVFLTDGSDKADELYASTAQKELGQLLDRFVIVRHDIRHDDTLEECKTCEKHKVTRGAHVHVIDPSEEDPYRRPLVRITGSRSTRSIESSLERAIATMKKRRKDV